MRHVCDNKEEGVFSYIVRLPNEYGQFRSQ